MNRFVALALFIGAAFLAALPGSLLTDAAWYQALARPPWAPPGWLFGPVWTALYIMIGAAGWLVWQRGGWAQQKRPLGVFAAQLALNCAWTPVFFGARAIGPAFALIVALWALIGLNVWVFWRARKAAGALLLPYWAWVSFAAALNFSIWQLNP